MTDTVSLRNRRRLAVQQLLADLGPDVEAGLSRRGYVTVTGFLNSRFDDVEVIVARPFIYFADDPDQAYPLPELVEEYIERSVT